MKRPRTLPQLLSAVAEKQAALTGAIQDLSQWVEINEPAQQNRQRVAEPIAEHSFSAAWFRGDLLPSVFGISAEAARKYRSGGLWLEGKHWRTDPANRIVYSRQAIEAWMGGEL